MTIIDKKPSSKSNAIFQWIPGLLISAIAIFALTKFVNIDSAIDILKKVNILYFLLMALFTLGFLFVRAIGWQALLGPRATYSQTFLKLNEGYFINNIFPFKLGEISRAVFMGAKMKVNPGQILSTIFVERVFDLFILAFFLLLLLPHAIGMDWVSGIARAILVFVVLAAIGLYFVSRNYKVVKRWLQKHGGKVPFIEKRILPFVFAVLEGFHTLRQPSQLIKGFLGIIGSWFVSFIQYSLLLYLLLPKVEIWWGAFANTLLALGVALPSAPAGLGIFESSIVAALGIFKINQETALAFALIMHITQFLVTGAIGLFALIQDGYSLKGLFSNLQQQREIQMQQEQQGAEDV